MLRAMRLPLLLVVVLVAGCPATRFDADLATGSGGGSGSGSGGGMGAAPECAADSHCVPAGPKCCDCPTHAVPAFDPDAKACSEVVCGPMQCGSPMQAECKQGHCVLDCAPVACALEMCDEGFETDGNGCLTCNCAVPAMNECTLDSDCVRVREDCCGCAMGGDDTAVPASQAAAYEASLGCPPSPSCPGPNTCAPDLAARCVQGQCSLVTGALPANACGRADLPECPMGETCIVNFDDQATMHGVGVCLP
jgi:hypothetical protein